VTLENPSPRVELVPATPEHQTILANLLELYIHDFSEFFPIELDAQGRFGYAHLPLYWSEPDRYPFLIRVDGKVAGLALVKTAAGIVHGEEVWDVAEFFIVRSHRRRGLGMKAAHAPWARFPGRWEVRVMQSNHAALNFWQRAVTEFAGDTSTRVTIEKDGQPWHIFAFESAHAVSE
jgi:predicted acetyltransferase